MDIVLQPLCSVWLHCIVLTSQLPTSSNQRKTSWCNVLLSWIQQRFIPGLKKKIHIINFYLCSQSKLMLYIDLRPGQTCHSKDGGSDTFRWQLWEEIAYVGLADDIGQGKIPWYSHRLMHRKRMTCELADSNFRLMTIKHAIPKILSGNWTII